MAVFDGVRRDGAAFAGTAKGIDFADFTDCLIVVNVLCGSNEGMTEAALEELADKIDFKVLKEVQVPDMRGDTEVSGRIRGESGSYVEINGTLKKENEK